MELIQTCLLAPTLKQLSERGANVGRYLRATGLDVFDTENPMAWLPKHLVFEFLEHVNKRELSSNRFADLESAYQMSNTYHYGGAILSAPSMLSAARLATSPAARIVTYNTLRLDINGPSAVLSSHFAHEDHKTQSDLEYLALVLMFDAIEKFGGKGYRLLSVETTLDSLPKFSVDIDLANTPIKFGQAAQKLEFPTSWLSRKARWDKNYGGPSDWAPSFELSEQISALFDALEPGRRPTLALMSDWTETSERTIQRRLAAENTDFKTLVDNWAFKTSIKMLEDPSWNIAEISERVGYTEPAHFSRAMKRWTGEGPKAYRNALS